MVHRMRRRQGLVLAPLLVMGWRVGGCKSPTMPSTTAGGRPAPTALSSTQASSVGTAASTGEVDVLNFVVGNASTWPRLGTQLQDQRVDTERREVCWVKYARSDAFECWRWDDAFVYHEVDHAVDGFPGASYRFSDGRWLPRHLPVNTTWTLDVSTNTITNDDANCVASQPRVFPYRVTARIEPAQVVSADLGTRRVLVLEYAPHAIGEPASQPETFTFAEGAGWFAWVCVRGGARFDTLGGPSLDRTLFCGER